MAITLPGAMNLTIKDVWTNTRPIAMLTDTLKGVLYDNTITPNFDTATRYGTSPFTTSGEINWAGAAGGVTITSVTLTITAGSLILDAADTPSAAAQTFSGARGLLWIDSTAATPDTNPAILLLDFDQDFGVINGVFTVQYHPTNGVWVQDNTPAT